jgi:hypothetical protein
LNLLTLKFLAPINVGLLLTLLFFLYIKQNKAKYDLEIDAIKDQTDISGIFYRIKVFNTGKNQLNDIEVKLGKNDIQHLKSLAPGKSFFYPRPDTERECTGNYKRVCFKGK